MRFPALPLLRLSPPAAHGVRVVAPLALALAASIGPPRPAFALDVTAPDPLLLPEAATVPAPLGSAYEALGVPALSAGGSYRDPATGTTVYRLTTASWPAAGAGWTHDHSDGGDEVSLPREGGVRSVLVREQGGAWWLLDFSPAAGVSNPRRLSGDLAPCGELAFAFSNSPATPHYAYVSSGSAIRRFDVRTMEAAPGHGWPVVGEPGATWLHQSEGDGMFVWLRRGARPTLVAFEPGTNTKKTYAGDRLEHPRLDRGGRYVALALGGGELAVWDWDSGRIAWRTTEAVASMAGAAGLKRRWLIVDGGADRGTFTLISPEAADWRRLAAGAGGLAHGSGNWIQHAADPDDQWALFSGAEAIVVLTPNGQRRLLAHPYSADGRRAPTQAKFAPDGGYVLFTSDMNGSGRRDVFLAELPRSGAEPDGNPPAVSITAPAGGSVVSGQGVTVTALASDDREVLGVQFELDGRALGPEDTAAPYAVAWDAALARAGTHVLTASARDAAGNVGTSRPVAVIVRDAGGGEAVIQVAPRVRRFSPQDTYINIDATNWSTSARLRTYTWPDYKLANAILMKFDLSGLPQGAVVTGARLWMALVESDAQPAATYTVTVHKVVGKNPVIAGATGYTADGVTPWTPNPCCHNNVPLAQADISAAAHTVAVDKTPGFKSWAVTGMVREWLANPASNHGLLLNSDPSKPRDHYRFFASMEEPAAALRPYLRITYTTVRDWIPPSVSITAPANGATVAGTVTVSANATDNVGVAGVQFKLDGANLGAEDTAPPYSVPWNTTATPNGSHALTAVARDAAGNQATSPAVTVTVANGTPGGIAAQYPGDIGIEAHPDVVFVERFDDATLPPIFGRWTDILNGAAMSLSADVPAGSPGPRSLDIPWVGGGVNTGGHLYKLLPSGVDATLHVRYYVKYPVSTTYRHSGIWMGGHNPPLAWPNPQAGVRPLGNDRFSAAAEQNTQTARFDHYDYWMEMRQSSDGYYWGNLLLNDPDVQAGAGQWTCVEHMIKLNNPLTARNGEHAIWLDGVEVSHLGQGFPNGFWSGGIFTQDPNGNPFEGFRWRSDANLKLNWIWLQAYAPDAPPNVNSSIRYDHVVLAKSYIGCLAPAGPPDTTPPVVSITAPPAGATVSGTAVTVSASATDNVGVVGVQFKLDGANLGPEDTTPPYSMIWDTTTVPNGSHTLTAVARDAAGNSATSAPVVVTVNNPPGGAWPNEPAGLTLRTDWGLDQPPPTSGDVPIPGSGGWKVVGNSPPGSPGGWAERVSDASAPFSPVYVYDFVYPEGMVEGEAPATVYFAGLSANEVYAGFWWKPSSPFDYGPNGNKIAFIFNGGGGAGGQQFMILKPDGRLHVLPEYPGDYQWRPPNVNPTFVTLGAWHRIEWYSNRQNGTLKWWLDGVLQGSYTNVFNSHPFDMFQLSPTWGGNSGATKQQTDHYWYDHVHLSTR